MLAIVSCSVLIVLIKFICLSIPVHVSFDHFASTLVYPSCCAFGGWAVQILEIASSIRYRFLTFGLLHGDLVGY